MAKKKVEVEGGGLSAIDILKKASSKGGMGDCVPNRPKLSTGSLALDLKLGGGVASDRIVEWHGKTGSYKTSMALMTLKSHIDLFPDDKRLRVIIDLERTITANHLRGFGIDPSKIWIEKPVTAEETMDFLSAIIKSDAASWILLDSIDALESEEETQKNYHESSMMKLAKLLSRAMREFSKSVVDHNTSLQMINQIRAGSNGYQMIETTSGGAAVPYYSSQRLKMKKSSKAANNPEAALLEATVIKNKLYPTISAESSFEFVPSRGVDIASDRLAAGIQLGVVVQGGPYYSIFDGTETLIYKAKGAKEFGGWLLSDGNQPIFDGLIREFHDRALQTLVAEQDPEAVKPDEDSYSV